jgi:hypothetical protein
MAQQSRIGLQTDINADIADNTTADISPADVRLILTDINDSAVNKLTDTNLIGWYEFDATKAYYTNELVIYSDNLYKFNQNHAAGAWNTAHADLAYFNGATQFSASLTISSADVKTLNSVPKTLVTCPTGRQIIVTGASLKCGNGNTAYLVDLDVIVTTNTASQHQVMFDNILANFTTAAHVIGALNTAAYIGGETQILANQNLVVTTPTADPTTGNYNITLYVTFRMV